MSSKTRYVTRWVNTDGVYPHPDIIDDKFFQCPHQYKRSTDNLPDNIFSGYRLVDIHQELAEREVDPESGETIGTCCRTFVYKRIFDDSRNEKRHKISSKEDLLNIIGNPERYTQT